MIEWIVQNVSFENVFAVKKRKLNDLKKHGLVKGNVVLLYSWLIHDQHFPKIINVK